MNDDPHIALLNRKESDNVKKYYGKELETMNEIIEYGLGLLKRCYATSPKKDITDVILLGMLLKNALSMLDSIEILIAQASVLSAHLPLRGLFETYLYILWILKEETEIRAKKYYVWHIRNNLLWNKRQLIGSKECNDFEKELDNYSNDFMKMIQEKQGKIIDNIKQEENILNSKNYRSVNEEFSKMKKGAKWFESANKKKSNSNRVTIRDLAKEINRSAAYRVFYSFDSSIAHGTAINEYVSFNKNEIVFVPIRNLEGIKNILMQSMIYSWEIYEAILKYYRPAEISSFKEKYKIKWVKVSKNIKNIEINVQLSYLN